jgi:hypothetical protein
VPWSGDTGDPGWKVVAYTAQLGNGVSASISAEQPRDASVINTSIANEILAGKAAPTDAMGNRHPDIVGNLRIDQAWGSAQVMAAWHDASAGYYGTGLTQVTPLVIRMTPRAGRSAPA